VADCAAAFSTWRASSRNPLGTSRLTPTPPARRRSLASAAPWPAIRPRADRINVIAPPSSGPPEPAGPTGSAVLRFENQATPSASFPPSRSRALFLLGDESTPSPAIC
jgi:hypothetical protein